jgi:hypothetical protein
MAAADSSLCEFPPGFILGFHGTRKDVVEKVLSGEDSLKMSVNDHDWLGSGLYFL